MEEGGRRERVHCLKGKLLGGGGVRREGPGMQLLGRIWEGFIADPGRG